ncbi:MAG: DUF3311 domain-containing protein [Acetobacteraceae bacterium]|nr:DUF3311 domain-containing protein [Acetobacteraceae bacterium]MBV9118521.1 DUF3311 domain-containing protein [Acetobacteraceae bacterium]MBV9777800.1 DUF3311 domain-containing protein [Acetobacteraceae bacterium]
MPTPYRPTGPAHRWSWVRVLLLLPFAALFWVPSYNTVEPAAFGVPFFYWYQLAWIVVSSLIIGLVYLVEHRGTAR